jgi:hypothetical protein
MSTPCGQVALVGVPKEVFRGLLAFPSWVTPLVRATIWPVVVLLLVLPFVVTRRGRLMLSALASRVKGVKAFGVEVDLSEQAAVQAKASLEDIFASYRARIKTEFDRKVYAYRITNTLENILERVFIPELKTYWKRRTRKGRPPRFRCTIHVPDLLFDGALYQLVDYYPSGGGRGRAYSDRYGIIGVSWRLRRDRYQGTVSKESDDLVLLWAMTRQEATAAGHGRQSFACILLEERSQVAGSTNTGGGPVGILYLDSEVENAFGEEIPGPGGASKYPLTEMLEMLKDATETSGLASNLAKLGNELRQKGPAVKVYGSLGGD